MCVDIEALSPVQITAWIRISRGVTQWPRQSSEFAPEIEGTDTVLINGGKAVAHAQTNAKFERFAGFSAPRRITSACRVFDFFDFNYSSQMRNFCNLRFEPCFGILAFRFPSGDYEQSNVHAFVAAADFFDEFSAAQDLLVVYGF